MCHHRSPRTLFLLSLLIIALRSPSVVQAASEPAIYHFDGHEFGATVPADFSGWARVYTAESTVTKLQRAVGEGAPEGGKPAVSVLGQFARCFPRDGALPVHSPEDPEATIEFDVRPGKAQDAWFGLGRQLIPGSVERQNMGPTFGFHRGQFALRLPAFGELSHAPLLPGDTLQHWYRLRLVIDFTAHNGDGTATVWARNLTRRSKDFVRLIGPVNLQLSRCGAADRNPLNWDSLFIRGGMNGPREPAHFARLVPVASRGIPEAKVPRRSALPQDFPHQRELVSFLSTLTADDLRVQVTPFKVPEDRFSPAELYQLFLLNGANGIPDPRSLRIPAEFFTLQGIEKEGQVHIPGPAQGRRGRPDAVSFAWYGTWNFPGNPYFNHRSVKMRAMVCNIIDLLMLERSHDQKLATRSDFLGGTMIWLASGYLQCKDVLPPQAQAAYETALRRMVAKLQQWGPTGLMTDMDLFVLVSMAYVSKVFPDDPAIQQIAQDLTRQLVTNPRFFHPAGYFRDLGCYDVTYNGISLYMLTWCAAIVDWPHIHDALAKAYRLRAHMALPEVGGGYFGPSHFSSRTSGDAANDQWNWVQRNSAAAALTDEALPALGMMTNDGLAVLNSNRHLQSPRQLVGYLNRTLEGEWSASQQVWQPGHWTSHPPFAGLVITEEFLQRLTQAHESKSPALQPHTVRSENYIRHFANVITVAKTTKYSAILHTGPIGGESGPTFHGLGGGTLSAFGTTTAGPVILGRRGGAQGTEHIDRYEHAMLWPVHAVTARTTQGHFVSTARHRDPKVTHVLDSLPATLQVEGVIPSRKVEGSPVLTGTMRYSRTFTMHDDRLHIVTHIQGDGADRLSQLFESIPVFLGQPVRDQLPSLRIIYQSDSEWKPLAAEIVGNVRHLRIERQQGVVDLLLDAPASVSLAPQEWQDHYQSRVKCRNILVHLPVPAEGSGQAWSVTTGWTLVPQ